MSYEHPPIYQHREFLSHEVQNRSYILARVDAPEPGGGWDHKSFCATGNLTLAGDGGVPPVTFHYFAEGDEEYKQVDDELCRLIGVLSRFRDGFKSAHITAEAYRKSHHG